MIAYAGVGSKYAASHTKLLKTRDDAKKKVMGTFQKIRNKWSESDKLVCPPLSPLTMC